MRARDTYLLKHWRVQDPAHDVRVDVEAGVAVAQAAGAGLAAVLKSLCECVHDGENGPNQNCAEYDDKRAENFAMQSISLRAGCGNQLPVVLSRHTGSRDKPRLGSDQVTQRCSNYLQTVQNNHCKGRYYCDKDEDFGEALNRRTGVSVGSLLVRLKCKSFCD